MHRRSRALLAGLAAVIVLILGLPAAALLLLLTAGPHAGLLPAAVEPVAVPVMAVGLLLAVFAAAFGAARRVWRRPHRDAG